MRKLLFESVCFVASMAYAPIMAVRYRRDWINPPNNDRFNMAMALAAVSVFVAVICLAYAFLKQDNVREQPPV